MLGLNTSQNIRKYNVLKLIQIKQMHTLTCGRGLVNEERDHAAVRDGALVDHV